MVWSLENPAASYKGFQTVSAPLPPSPQSPRPEVFSISKFCHVRGLACENPPPPLRLHLSGLCSVGYHPTVFTLVSKMTLCILSPLS